MIHEFELWSAPRTDTNNLSDLSGCVVAIEADFFLDRLLNDSPAKEPLLSALGGTPFSLQTHLEKRLDILRLNGIKPLLVFNGLDVGRNYAPFAQGDAVASANIGAWDLYNRHQPTEAVQCFGSSGYATPKRYYALVQRILLQQNVDFQVAPYSALGQLAYLSRYAPDYVDAIAGCSELLLYDVDRVITGFDFSRAVGGTREEPKLEPQLAEYTFVRKQQCVEELNIPHPELFTDACMLSGCSLLPTLPSLGPARMPKIRQVVDILKTNIQPGNSVYTLIEKDQRNVESDYLDRYKQSRMAVKHDVVLTTGGKVEPLASDDVPNDLHDIIGQRLPDELYYYLSVGAVGTRILNHLTSAQIYENCPADGGESEIYKILVSEKLTSLRALTLALLAFRLHRAYHHRVVQLFVWHAPDRKTQINVNDQSDPNEPIKAWRFAESALSESLDFSGPQALLSSAIKTANSSAFQSLPNDTTLLHSTNQLKANTIFRFLYFRGYLTDTRNLTPWGKVLSAMITALPQYSRLEQGLLLATEMLRLDLLTSDTMFPRYTGAPMHGSESDRANTLLLARVACLAKLHHQSIGFTGPLSRHLLAYSCLVDAVRTNLRDLLDMSLVSLLLTGHAERERTDLTEVSVGLPLLLPLDCALGIAMKHYLDDVNAAAVANKSEVTLEMRDQAKDRGPNELFPHVRNFKVDLEAAFLLWDAIYAGVKLACEHKLLAKSDPAYWDGVDNWVQQRR